jgi:hypothetical protein
MLLSATYEKANPIPNRTKKPDLISHTSNVYNWHSLICISIGAGRLFSI